MRNTATTTTTRSILWILILLVLSLFEKRNIFTNSFLLTELKPSFHKKHQQFSNNNAVVSSSINKKCMSSTSKTIISATVDSSSEQKQQQNEKEKTTIELNLELSRLYHQTEETGNIGQVYEMEKKLFSYTNNTSPPFLDTVSYNTLLSTWNKMAYRYEEGTVMGKIPAEILPKNHVYVAKDVALRAQKVLKYMEDKDLADVTSYNIVIDAWAKSKSPDGGKEVEIMLRRMLASEDDLSPDVITFNGILDTCINRKHPNIEEKVEEMFTIMNSLEISPNTRTYNLVISAYSKSIANHLELNRSTRPKNQQQAKDRKQQLSEQAQQKRMNDNNQIETRELQRKGSKRVLELLEEIKEDSDGEENTITASTYTAVIDCMARCCLPHQCERLLLELEELYANKKKTYEFSKDKKNYPISVLSLSPNIRTYTALINAWSWSKYEESPYKALTLLQKVEEQYTEAVSKKELYDDNYCNSIKPNVRTYTAVISCIGHSRLSEKAKLAFGVLKRLLTRYKESNDIAWRPNIYTYNAVIDTCAKVYASNSKFADSSEMQNEALKIAFDVFKLVRKDKSVKANYVTYGTLLKATKNLLPPGDERSQIIQVLFGRCCKEGHVDLAVLKQLRQTVDVDLYKKLLGDDVFDGYGSVNFEKLPKSWSRSVRS